MLVLDRNQGRRLALFIMGSAIFLVIAALGWSKLKYGLNFTDEGMYMTDGWRLAAGDRLFPDSRTNVVRLYSIFNSFIFRLWPEIGLLDFRRIHFFSSLGAVFVLGFSVYKWIGTYWLAPYAMAVFAFTGLDAMGQVSNMSYGTYPHLFLIFHISAMSFGIRAEQGASRRFYFALSGLFLWAIGFCYLPLSLMAVSPLALGLVLRCLKSDKWRLSMDDLIFSLAPVAVMWIGILAYFNRDFLDAMVAMYGYFSGSGVVGAAINWDGLPYVGMGILYFAAFLFVLRLPGRWAVAASIFLSAGIYAVMVSDLFGAIKGFWFGWFSYQMWFSAILYAFGAAFTVQLVRARLKGRSLSTANAAILLIVVPCAICVVVFGNSSGTGMLAPMLAAIPLTLAMVLFVMGQCEALEFPVEAQLSCVVALLLPFFVLLARNDWRQTMFDLPPRFLSSTIQEGFAAGIRTNPIFAALADWIRTRGAKYADEGEFAIFANQVAMGYMLTGLRPSLDHSWTDMALSQDLKRDSLEAMKKAGREPAIAVRFPRALTFFPIDKDYDRFNLAGVTTTDPQDPIYAYLTNEMELVENFKADGTLLAEFYIRRRAEGGITP